MFSQKSFRLMAIAALSLTLLACASSVIGGKIQRLANFDETRLGTGQGAVLLHAVNQGSLIATRWYKMDDPDRKYSFTVYRSDRHRALDRMDDYDVVMVEPGTYVLYSVYSNCEDGLRPASTEWDDEIRPEVATALGQVSWLRSWKPGTDVSTGVGIWGGSGGRSGLGMGVGFSLGGSGVGSGPGTPVATCNLLSSGMAPGGPSLATITVKAGEVVYAGELNISYGSTSTCDVSGNWMTDNETRQYCGADWMSLNIIDRSGKARMFIEKALGPVALQKTVVRLAEPGTLVSSR
jgi:hypothetical protein